MVTLDSEFWKRVTSDTGIMLRLYSIVLCLFLFNVIFNGSVHFYLQVNTMSLVLGNCTPKSL